MSPNILPRRVHHADRTYKYNLAYDPALAGRYRPLPLVRNLLTTTQRLLRGRTILFYPELPGFPSVLFKVCHMLGCRITHDPSQDFDLAIWWEDTTFPEKDAVLERLMRRHDVINARCTDISKTRVERVFRDVFGYSSTVDSLAHEGPCVKKSILNSIHKDQAEVVECPVETTASDVIYQRLIDNTVNGAGVAEDLRVPIFRQSIPFVYLKYRPLDDRFYNVASSTLAEVNGRILGGGTGPHSWFTDAFGLDYGELDVLRDASSSRIYIVDANNTPSNTNTEPSLSDSERREALQRLAKAFQKAFL